MNICLMVVIRVNMDCETNHRSQFKKAEEAINITSQSFAQKFIYSHATPNNFLLHRQVASPSQLQGFSIEQERNITYLMSQILFRAGESLKLPVSTTIVAASISHFFFSRKSFLDHDFRDVAMGAMFLACKSQETLRRSYEISAVFDHIFKIFEGQKAPIKAQVLNSLEYEYMRNKVIEFEKTILFEEGFQVYRLFDIPHRYIGGLFKSFQRHPEGKKICQKAWIYLNDFYKTNACLYYPGQIIGAASLYMSLLKLKIKMPTVPWWILMEANLLSIEELIIDLEYFYQQSSSKKYTMDQVASMISEVGERHKYINVFPVSYYRKIILDTNKQLKIKKNSPLPQDLQQDNDIQEIKEIKDRDNSSEQNSYKKRKKEKKKEKKDKKEKKKKKDKHKKKHYEKDQSPSQSREKKYSSQSHHEEVSPENKNVITPIIEKNKQPSINKSNQNREVVRNLQISNKSELFSKINSQLSKFKKVEKSKREQNEEDEDQELLADLIKIKKSNAQKKQES